ncbi:MAG: SpoVG family protein [Planctomycetes bacterium]|nr:SpoVG family protein [Planctomycetota bacterium]
MGLNITEIRVKLTSDPRNKLKAYCSVTFENAFVVRDLKIIDGAKGPFVAMPSRKLADRCPKCSHKNNLRASYCNQCGGRLDPQRAERDTRHRPRLHADLAHPINSDCRIQLHKAVVLAYSEELEQSKQAGYKPKTFDDFDDDEFIDDDYIHELLRRKEVRERERGDAGGAAAEAGM